MIVKKTEKRTVQKYAINQVTQCETEPQAIETTNVIATLYSKARAAIVTVYKFQQPFPKRKYIVHKFPTEIKTDLITNHFTRVT